MNKLKQFAEELKNYIKRQNFSGSYFSLKKNILNRIDELEEIHSLNISKEKVEE